MRPVFPDGRLLLVALGLAIAPNSATAASVFAVQEPWVRVAPNGRSAEAFMRLRSSDGATIVAVRSEMVVDVAIRPPGNGGATVNAIPLPPGVTVELAPGAYRLVLPKLDRSLKLGDRVPLLLTVEAADGSRQEIPVNAEVRRRSPTDDHLRPHKH